MTRTIPPITKGPALLSAAFLRSEVPRIPHIKIIVPKGSMLRPRFPAAVAGGNVETSQTVVNCLYGALGVLGSAQGTMNNLTFGDERFQYYETICSGAPAGEGFDGAAAVQTHMTNSRLTDPEVLELRYPVLLERFSIQRGSGGKGKWRAGDGTLRVIRFLERMECAILSGFRKVRPFGLHGGDNAAAFIAQRAQFIERGQPLGGMDVTIHGDIPQGAGLSSSAALEVATGLALVVGVLAAAVPGSVPRPASFSCARKSDSGSVTE